jgi:secreted trypsin-like serine protease
MVSISHNAGGGYNDHMCGGTLISKYLVLTAAHCVFDGKRLMSVSGYTLQIGINDLQNDQSLGNAYEIRKVAKVIPHPNYKPLLYCDQGGACKAYDMAILVMDRQVTTIKPIALPRSKKINLANKSFYILGWGSYNFKGDVSKILRYAQVPYIPVDTCNVLSKKFNLRNIPPTHMCAGDSTNLADTCAGDSGGPLILQNAKGRYLQVGVTSYGAPKKCGYTYYQTSQTVGKRKKEKKEKKGTFGVYSSTAALNAFLKSAKKIVAPV